jgi:capsular polysaccharide biosynthesis protein
MEIIFSKQEVLRNKPKNFSSNDEHLFQNSWIVNSPECHVLNIKLAVLVWYSIFVPSKFKFLDKYSFQVKPKIKTKIKRCAFLFMHRYVTLDKAIWVTDLFSLNYFHWFTDCLPRLVMVESKIDGHVLVLPKKFEEYSFVRDSLKFFKIDPYYFDPNKNLIVFDLILPSQIGKIGEYRNELFIKINKKFHLSGTETIPTRKIFINRRLSKRPLVAENKIKRNSKISKEEIKAQYRRVLNETEIIEALNLIGVEVHYFDEYTLLKQIQLMSETKTLIGLHGAGLTNMIFMPKGGNIVELRNQYDGSFLVNCFFNLSGELGHNYFYTTNESTDKRVHYGNFQIDILKLVHVLQNL